MHNFDMSRAEEDVREQLLKDFSTLALVQRQKEKIAAMRIACREETRYSAELTDAAYRIDDKREDLVCDILVTSTWLFGYPVVVHGDAINLIEAQRLEADRKKTDDALAALKEKLTKKNDA